MVTNNSPRENNSQLLQKQGPGSQQHSDSNIVPDAKSQTPVLPSNQIQLQPIDKQDLSSKGALAVSNAKPPQIPPKNHQDQILKTQMELIQDLRERTRTLEDQLSIAD